jgi:hypothetical protein
MTPVKFVTEKHQQNALLVTQGTIFNLTLRLALAVARQAIIVKIVTTHVSFVNHLVRFVMDQHQQNVHLVHLITICNLNLMTQLAVVVVQMDIMVKIVTTHVHFVNHLVRFVMDQHRLNVHLVHLITICNLNLMTQLAVVVVQMAIMVKIVTTYVRFVNHLVRFVMDQHQQNVHPVHLGTICNLIIRLVVAIVRQATMKKIVIIHVHLVIQPVPNVLVMK